MPVFSQTQNKVIEWSKKPLGSNHERAGPGIEISREIDVAEIVDFMVDGKSIFINEPFAAGEDWLKGFTVRVRNASDQRLDSVQITLVLPQTKPDSPHVVFCYGCAAAQREKGINPGEVVELKMPGSVFYDWVRSRIEEKSSVSAISKAEIGYIFVKPFSGLTWYSGCMKTVNPKNACPRNAP